MSCTRTKGGLDVDVAAVRSGSRLYKDAITGQGPAKTSERSQFTLGAS